MREPGFDLDLADPALSDWNRLAAGLLDEPVEVPLTELDVLAIVDAENIVTCEIARLGWQWWIDE